MVLGKLIIIVDERKLVLRCYVLQVSTSGCEFGRITETMEVKLASSRDPYPFPRLQNDESFYGAETKQVLDAS